MRIPPLLWDAALWSINNANPAAAVPCYSKFKLSMDSNGKVSCKCVEREGLQDMLRRAENQGYVLPISKAAPGPESSSARETLGSVDGYYDIGTMSFGLKNRYIDLSGRTLSSVVMVSKSAAKVLTVKFLLHKFDILLDDGMVLSGRFEASVDIHCDDISSSELLKADCAYCILCKNTDIGRQISFSALLVHLKKKLNLHLTQEEWGLYSATAVDAEEDNEDLMERRRKEQNWVPAKPKHDLEEVELHECSMLFSGP